MTYPTVHSHFSAAADSHSLRMIVSLGRSNNVMIPGVIRLNNSTEFQCRVKPSKEWGEREETGSDITDQ